MSEREGRIELSESDLALLAVLQTHLGGDARTIVSRGLRALAAATGWPMQRDRRSPLMMSVVPSFSRAAAAACEFELRMRLLADNAYDEKGEHVFKLKSIVQDFDRLTAEMIDHFSTFATDDDASRLKKAVRVRNKLFHIEMSRVAGTLVSLGTELREGAVIGGELHTGETAPVAESKSRDGDVYGWLWEAHLSGAFDACVDLFRSAIEVAERWRDAADAAHDGS